MSYKLTISDPQNGFNFNARYEKMDRAEKPDVIAKSPTGEVVSERTVSQGQVLLPGSTQKQWVNEAGKPYSKAELTFWYKDEQVAEIAQTKVFTVAEYVPFKQYIDDYVIDKFYEVFPSDNDMKKEIDQEQAIKANRYQMRKLWEYLVANDVVARGEFNTSSKGFVSSDGFIRALKNGSQWGLEIGKFKEQKVFHHMQEGIPAEIAVPVMAAAKKKIKLM